MTIEQAAQIYVDYVDPALRVLLFFVIAVFLLYMLSVIRDGKKKTDVINATFNFIIKFITKTISFMGKLLLFIITLLRKTITVIYASIRDFFFSRI